MIDRIEIKARMAQAGCKTMVSFAAKTGIQRLTLSNFFNGLKPSFDFICKVQAALELTPEDVGRIFFDNGGEEDE